MAIFVLDNGLDFPAPHLAEPDGLLAIGGDLSTERLLAAYRKGIFPWYDGGPILWWSPDPRFTLLPSAIRINKTVKSMLNRDYYDFTVNQSFREVIGHCKKIPRPGQEGTWITDEVERAYIRLHELGHAHSAEVWKEGTLVGGLYGIRMGKVFFGESMFSLESQASRYAFIRYVKLLESEGIELIDCQTYTAYLESLGATMMEGQVFSTLLDKLIN
ncbi:MAG: leucyl/phenylalanyl-tRNA--protein transferase [Chitinophagaceae bacterium]